MNTTEATLKIPAVVTKHKNVRGKITGYSAELGNLYSDIKPTRAEAIADLTERLARAASDRGSLDIVSGRLPDGDIWSAVVTSDRYTSVVTESDGTLHLRGSSGGTRGGFDEQRASARAHLRSLTHTDCRLCGKTVAFGPGLHGTGEEVSLYFVAVALYPFYVCAACDDLPGVEGQCRARVPGLRGNEPVKRIATRAGAKSICPNCDQWQHPRTDGPADCVNECRRRGFAPSPVPVYTVAFDDDPPTGPPCSLAEFVAINADGWDGDASDLARLAVGEAFTCGGGASPVCKITRVS